MNIEKKRYIIFLYSLFLMNFVIFVIFTGENEMEILKQRILKDGVVKEGNVLKVDKFLNHQMDVKLFNDIGEEFARRFAGLGVNKILTIEASGIGIACIAAQHFNNCPIIFAKKTLSQNLDGQMYITQVKSYTKGVTYDVMVSKKYLGKGDKVLIIDDFPANGCALMGLIHIVEQSGADLVGAGIVIEKGFQVGGQTIRDMGIKLESLAIIDSMDDGKIVFRD